MPALPWLISMLALKPNTLGGCTFDVLTHAKLIGTLNPGGANNTPAGIVGTTPDYEITLVARYTEVVTTFAGSFAAFTTVTSAPMFLEMYFDSSPDSVDVSGFGFNDGDLILSGSQVASATGSFLITSSAPVLLDQHTTNQYGPTIPLGGAPSLADQATVTGTGSNTNTAVTSPLQTRIFRPPWSCSVFPLPTSLLACHTSVSIPPTAIRVRQVALP